MRTRYRCLRPLVWLAAVGMMIPPSGINAQQPNLHRKDAPRRAGVAMLHDTRLVGRGELRGTVTNAQGRALANTEVRVRDLNGKMIVARTNAAGQFAATGLRGGIYQVTAGHASQVIRAWAPGTAPPRARGGLLLVSDPNVVVGQWEPGTLGYFIEGMKGTLSNPLVVGGIIAAAVAIPVAIHNADDDDPPSGS